MSNVRRQPARPAEAARLKARRQAPLQALINGNGNGRGILRSFFSAFFFLILNSRRGAVIIAKSTWQILFKASLKLLPSICVT